VLNAGAGVHDDAETIAAEREPYRTPLPNTAPEVPGWRNWC
jgi:hypothetical protein